MRKVCLLGEEILIDPDCSTDFLSLVWYKKKNRASVCFETFVKKPNGLYGSITLQRLLVGVHLPGLKISFKNGNCRDYRRENLEVVDHKTIMNKRRKNGVRVYFDSSRGKFKVYRFDNGVKKYLGIFSSSEEIQKSGILST